MFTTAVPADQTGSLDSQILSQKSQFAQLNSQRPVSEAGSRRRGTLAPLTRSTFGSRAQRNPVRYVRQGFMQQAHGSPIVGHTSRSRDNSVMLASYVARSRRRSRLEQTRSRVDWQAGTRVCAIK